MGASISMFPEMNKIVQRYPKSIFRPYHLVAFARGFASQSTPSVGQSPKRKKEMGALTSILHQLKDAPRPHPKPMFPSAYLHRGGLPLNQIVSAYDETPMLGGPMVYELRVDVWPSPLCWILHGIWPAYISGQWLIFYKLEKMDAYELYLLKEQVKQEIRNLDNETKETLHEIWKSYKNIHSDSREQDIDFWAYEKITHCWDALKCPPGQYFNLTANLGKYVRKNLLNWIKKSKYTPNHFYRSQSIREEMRNLFGARVHLIVKSDDDMDSDPESTEISFLHSLALLVVKDDTQEFWYNICDHPSAFHKIPDGNLFLLM